MRNVSQAWKDIYNQSPDYAYGQYQILYPYKTLDLIPESNMLVVLGGDYTKVNTMYYSDSGYTVDNTYKLGANNPKEIATFEKKRACFGLNEFVLDGSCTVNSDTSLKFYSDIFSDENCEFDDEVYFELRKTTAATVQGIVSLRFYPELNEYATDYDVRHGYYDTDYSTNYIVDENKQNYVHKLSNFSGSNTINVKINKWSFPYTRAKISQMVWGRQVIFEKTNIESLTYIDSINPVNDELPCQTLTVNAFDYDREWDVHSGVYIGNDELLSKAYLYAMYNTKNGWERISFGYYLFDSIERLQNGNTVKLEFSDPLQKCKDRTNVWSVRPEESTVANSVVEVLEQIHRINSLPAYVQISSNDYSDLHEPNTDVGFYGAHDSAELLEPSHYTEFTLAELMQNLASMVGGTIIRGKQGDNRYYIRNLKPLTFKDTIYHHTEYTFPEIEKFMNFKTLSIRYEITRLVDSTMHLLTENRTYTNPSDVTNEEDITVENRLSTICNRGSNSYDFPNYHKQFYIYYMLNRKEYNVECVTNPAWQAGDKIHIQTREGTTADGLITSMEINYNGTFKGKVKAMMPYAWTMN